MNKNPPRGSDITKKEPAFNMVGPIGNADDLCQGNNFMGWFSYSLFTKCTKDDMRQSSYGELKKGEAKDKDNKKRDKWGEGNARET